MSEAMLVQEVRVFDPFKQQLIQLQEENRNTVFNYEDKKGNKDARSHVAQLRKTKSAVEKVRKDTKQASLEYGRKVDKDAREVSDQVQEMIDVHAVPLKEIQEREEKLKQEISERIEGMRALGKKINPETQQFFTSGELQDNLFKLGEIKIDDSFGDWQIDAVAVQNEAIKLLETYIDEAQEREEKEAELARYKKEETERKAKERDDRVRKETEDRLARESKEREEKTIRESKEREERIKREAEQKLDRERREATERENKIIRDAERKEERLRKEKEEQAAAGKRREEKIKRDNEERQRKEQEKRDTEERDRLRREANAQNRRTIQGKIVKQLGELGVNGDLAFKVVDAISENKINNVSIRY